MKKIFFAIPIVVLIATGCNSSPKVSSQTLAPSPVAQTTTPTPSSAPTATATPTPTQALGVMPKMSFTLTPAPSADVSQYTVNIFANGKQVATMSNENFGALDFADDTGRVVFNGGNSQNVLVSLNLDISQGTGAELYMLNLQNATVKLLVKNLVGTGLDWTSDLKYVAYGSWSIDQNEIVPSSSALNVLNTATMSDEVIALPGVPASFGAMVGFVGDIKFSPDQARVAVAENYGYADGPGGTGGTIYIVNLSSKAITTYQQSHSSGLSITDWNNNANPDWAPHNYEAQ